MKLSHGDSVIVISGKDKGKKGTIMRVLRAQNRVIVSGVNMLTKHVKRTAQAAGQTIKFEASLHASNVQILDPETGKGSRIGYKKDGTKKVRVAKKSGTVLTRVKGEAAKKEASPAKSSTKSPFWKKSGFGGNVGAETSGTSADATETAAPVATHRSGGRGS